MKKTEKMEKISNMLVYTLAVLMIFASALKNPLIMRILVIINAVTLLGTVICKIVRHK